MINYETRAATSDFQQRSTHLDGLRGWAAIIVLINHVFPNFIYQSYTFSSISELLSAPDISLEYFFNIIKASSIMLYLFISDGALAVGIFFVLSGYVLSTGYFKDENKQRIIDQALRRYLRLTIPVLGSVMMCYIIMKLGGLFHHEASKIIDSPWIAGFYNFEPGFLNALRFSLFDVYFFYNQETSYNFAAWTMAIELVGSFLIFALLLLINKRSRLLIYSLLLLMLTLIWPIGICFIIGAMVADFYSRDAWARQKKFISHACLMVLPFIPASTLIYTKIQNDLLAQIFQIGVATTILLISLTCKPIKIFLSNCVSQFLGKISFPLYLTHPIILCSAVSAFLVFIIPIVGDEFGRAIGAIFAGSVSILAAWLFMPVENTSINISRRFSKGVLNYISSKSRGV